LNRVRRQATKATAQERAPSKQPTLNIAGEQELRYLIAADLHHIARALSIF
jgi:hypothetical protein